MKRHTIVGWVVVATICVALLISTQITVFVVQPIGALPEGRTVILKRVPALGFISGPDALCLEIQGGVSLLCRAMAIKKTLDETEIVARLPYSAMLYSWSTGGRSFER